VNDAGTYEFAPLESVTQAHVRKHFDLDVLGLLLASTAAYLASSESKYMTGGTLLVRGPRA
jgi:hypothetical protein